MKIGKQKKFCLEGLQSGIFQAIEKKGISHCWDQFKIIVFEKTETGFAICTDCNLILRSSGFGGTSKLLKHCRSKHDKLQIKISHLSNHKKCFSKEIKENIKRAQMEFCVDTLTSFSLQESEGFYKFCDFLINFGIRHGAAQSKDILFERKVVKQAAVDTIQKLDIKLIEQLKGKKLGFVSDIWSSKFSNDSYLDIHASWLMMTK